jgi:hypothetical protein
MQNPESLSETKGPLTPGFASGFPEALSGKHLTAPQGYIVSWYNPGEGQWICVHCKPSAV